MAAPAAGAAAQRERRGAYEHGGPHGLTMQERPLQLSSRASFRASAFFTLAYEPTAATFRSWYGSLRRSYSSWSPVSL